MRRWNPRSPFSALTIVLVAVGCAAASVVFAQPAASTRPAEPIDYDRARALIDKQRRGNALTNDEQAYLDRARAARRAAARPDDRVPAGRPASRPATVSPPRESTGLIPLPEVTGDQKYKEFTGGLYGDGKNDPPEAHAAAAATAAAQVQPLDSDGKPSPGGKVVLMSIGMSNTTQEFSIFKKLADRDPAKSTSLVIADAAQGGRAADDWTDPKMPTYEQAATRLAAAGASEKQVQVVWIKQARRNPATLGDFPKHAKALQEDLEQILRAAKARYPNLKLAFLSSRIYAGYANKPLNPEPYAYEGAFSVQWVIARQVGGERSLNHDSTRGEVVAPVALWGPYLWADGTKGRKWDGLTYARQDLAGDGTHPSDSGQQKVAELLLSFFKSSPHSKMWFTR